MGEFRCKHGRIEICDKDYNKDHPIITKFVDFCMDRGESVDICRLITAIEPYNYSSISECLKFYIDCITRHERYGIVNDIIIVEVDIARIEGGYTDVLNQLILAGFIPLNFTSIDFNNDKFYYAHENDFVNQIITKPEEIDYE